MKHLQFRRKIKRWLKQSALITVILFLCCYIYGIKIEPNWIEVVPIQLTIPHLDPAFDQFKVVQISDLHSGRYMPESRFARIIQLVNQQQPDAIAITGDIVSKHSRFQAEKLQQQLSQLQAKTVIVAVLGNHDHSEKIKLLKRILVQSKIDNLDNQVYIVERGSKKLAFAGIDDPYWGKPNLNKILDHLPEQVPTIFLVHEPDYIETSAKTHKFALQLSGHSHGGQIRIPFFAPLVLPYGGRKYFVGLNQVEDTITYTNRGLGMTNLPMRIGSRPEITVFTLHS
ncbi:metallophosphoesterase [Pleurocapsa sp. CCALA 161]|uniref:metallophosphoesterase n=1 Tax=Pleurocapsa sp. CCALA 161 TaxID=2107688 RepID=UPI0013048D94|nr:metallophosphoesterase [Pleurocapsa sp. CCALA 161]